MKIRNYWAAAAVWVIVGGIIGGAAGYGLKPGSDSAQFVQSAPDAIPEKAFPGVRTNYVGSGTFRVPAQVTPGTYIVTASGLTFGCSWILRTNDDNKPKSVTDSGTVNRGGFDHFTISKNDRLLQFLGDCMWAEGQ